MLQQQQLYKFWHSDFSYSFHINHLIHGSCGQIIYEIIINSTIIAEIITIIVTKANTTIIKSRRTLENLDNFIVVLSLGNHVRQNYESIVLAFIIN
jgi:hypothetical protein